MPDTPPDLPTELLELLAAAGNKALNDHYHEELCHCSQWPDSCASTSKYFDGAWDTSAFDIGMAAIIAAYEQHKAQPADQPALGEPMNAAQFFHALHVGDLITANTPRRGVLHGIITATYEDGAACTLDNLSNARGYALTLGESTRLDTVFTIHQREQDTEADHSDCIHPHRTADGYADCDGRPL
jgi:hypothetical protein